MIALSVMKVVRVLSASFAVLLAATAAFLLLGMLMTVPTTLEHDKQIDGAFLRASSWVSDFKLKNGRLPANRELAAWSMTQKQSFWLQSIELVSDSRHFPAEAKKAFGIIPSEGYLLSLWRGEWNEYFASWTKTSTIGDVKDAVLFVVQGVVGSLLLFALSFILWRYRRPTLHSRGRA